MKNDSSGMPGLFVLIGAVILFFGLRRFFPVLSTVLLAVVGIVLLLVILLVVLVIYFSKQKPKEKGGSISTDASQILTKGRSELMELRRLAMRIKNQQIRTLNKEICEIVDKILRTLKEQPEDIPSARQFFNYYLPTMGKILMKYVRLEESGVPVEDMTAHTIACLCDIKTAMEKQYTNLFEDDMLDLSVEMEVLTLACKRDGLLSDEDFPFQNGSGVI